MKLCGFILVILIFGYKIEGVRGQNPTKLDFPKAINLFIVVETRVYENCVQFYRKLGRKSARTKKIVPRKLAIQEPSNDGQKSLDPGPKSVEPSPISLYPSPKPLAPGPSPLTPGPIPFDPSPSPLTTGSKPLDPCPSPLDLGPTLPSSDPEKIARADQQPSPANKASPERETTSETTDKISTGKISPESKYIYTEKELLPKTASQYDFPEVEKDSHNSNTPPVTSNQGQEVSSENLKNKEEASEKSSTLLGTSQLKRPHFDFYVMAETGGFYKSFYTDLGPIDYELLEYRQNESNQPSTMATGTHALRVLQGRIYDEATQPWLTKERQQQQPTIVDLKGLEFEYKFPNEKAPRPEYMSNIAYKTFANKGPRIVTTNFKTQAEINEAKESGNLQKQAQMKESTESDNLKTQADITEKTQTDNSKGQNNIEPKQSENLNSPTENKDTAQGDNLNSPTGIKDTTPGDNLNSPTGIKDTTPGVNLAQAEIMDTTQTYAAFEVKPGEAICNNGELDGPYILYIFTPATEMPGDIIPNPEPVPQPGLTAPERPDNIIPNPKTNPEPVPQLGLLDPRGKVSADEHKKTSRKPTAFLTSLLGIDKRRSRKLQLGSKLVTK